MNNARTEPSNNDNSYYDNERYNAPYEAHLGRVPENGIWSETGCKIYDDIEQVDAEIMNKLIERKELFISKLVDLACQQDSLDNTKRHENVRKVTNVIFAIDKALEGIKNMRIEIRKYRDHPRTLKDGTKVYEMFHDKGPLSKKAIDKWTPHVFDW